MGKKRAPSEKQIAYGLRRAAKSKAERFLNGKWLCRSCNHYKDASHFREGKRLGGNPPSYCRKCDNQRSIESAKRRRNRDAKKNAALKEERRKKRRENRLSELLFCKRCASTKPRSEWPIERGTDKGGFIGKTRKYCCSPKKRTREEVESDIKSGTKQCGSCGERKPFMSFSPHKLAQDGRQGTCRACRSAKTHSGEWHGNVRRQAIIDERSDGSITTDLIKQMFSIKTCPCCDGYMERDDKVLDHIIPLKLGGKHSASNVMVLCRYCNSGKSAHHPSRWLQLLKPEAAARMKKHYDKMGLNF